MAHLGVLFVSVAAQPLGCLVLLDEGPYRFEGEGARVGFMLPLGLKRAVRGGREDEMQDRQEEEGLMEMSWLARA